MKSAQLCATIDQIVELGYPVDPEFVDLVHNGFLPSKGHLQGVLIDSGISYVTTSRRQTERGVTIDFTIHPPPPVKNREA